MSPPPMDAWPILVIWHKGAVTVAIAEARAIIPHNLLPHYFCQLIQRHQGKMLPGRCETYHYTTLMGA